MIYKAWCGCDHNGGNSIVSHIYIYTLPVLEGAGGPVCSQSQWTCSDVH